MATAFAISGLIISIMLYEEDVRLYQTTVLIPEGFTLADMDAMESQRFLKWYNWLIKWIIFATSMLGVVCMMIRRKYKNMWFDNDVVD